jgi:hypothetical protein
MAMTTSEKIVVSRALSPTCPARTHTRYPTVAYNGNAMNCLKVSIQAPGRGSTFTAPGKIESSR